MNKDNTGLNEELHRGLEERHIQLMALGGAIGVGLFLGSASAIKTAGPSLLLAYAGGGAILFFIMRALGEIAVEHPVAGSFSAYANEFIGPLAGYLTGWTYWFMWIVTCMAEVTAVGVYVNFWFPTIPQWVSALGAVVIMSIVNLTAVKAFGEFEFWFALIKVVTIVIMIVIGIIMIVTGLGNAGKPTGISNLWSHGGFFPQGIKGTVMALQMVTFAFIGIELIGVTAGEAKNPQKTIPSAINKVFYRILIFYVGALFVIMSLYPWDQIGTLGSPFVLTFSKLGIVAAAGIINFVVLTAALSSCNSGIFTTGRMLYNLSLQGSAPKSFGKLSKSQVPSNAILISAFFMLIGVFLNYIIPAKVFAYVTSIATFAGIFAWFIILLAQMKFRKSLAPEEAKKLKFPMKGYPYANYISMAFLIFVLVVMCLSPDTLIAVIVGPIWLIILVAFYYGKGMNKHNNTKSE
ncbi:D-alanine/D-serine/glycine permease [Clostridium carboxidivorans P7]|uniref:Amino acid permease-associated region n=1 Tax=Clostridium carboxidivorans P7 TaxID=536227 RepID=C6PZS8_9CLOT|nr:amino acid permease [Clostridium carboxidivorans]AKN31761.1 D-alanine/D-serine/glycine permease [Clostridium carboxidivorans P7]EET85235.1 amino acid permease-associated region [Clostridium carboxidivorans P7]EFG87411.1 amino acid permease [Clostridium carboxidivorans P7]